MSKVFEEIEDFSRDLTNEPEREFNPHISTKTYAEE